MSSPRALFGFAGVAACVAAAIIAAHAQQATFRARTDVVSVAVSVMKGREPVVGLEAGDFEITDNGVKQTVDEVLSDEVPIDVTIVLTGRSADRSEEHGQSVASAEATRKLLHRADRLRMVWVTDEVAGAVAGEGYSIAADPATRELGRGVASATGVKFPLDPEARRSGFGIALADGLFYALSWPVDADRRHIVVAFTDGWDTTSTIEIDRLPALAGHSDAVLHAVLWVAPGEDTRNGGGLNVVAGNRDALNRAWERSLATLDSVVRRSGGQLHRTGQAANALADILADFRSSYVLRYTPRGVAAAGWHDLGVKVTRSGSFAIRARKGYEGR